MAIVDRDQALGVLRSLDQRFRPVTLADRQVLPVAEPLLPVLPAGGLRRGTTVAASGVAATSLAMSLVAEATRTGSWAVAVNMPALGLTAAGELGVALDRLALVPEVPRGSWPTVVAALVDAVDVVVMGPVTVSSTDVRRVLARARERGAVLVPVGDWWPEPVDLTLMSTASRWHGLGEGHGHLQARRVRLEANGRREAARPRALDLWLPTRDGGVAAVQHPSTRSDHRTGPVRLRPVG